eukprot:1696115-Alexandrium_andersonii.AAC.1
MLARPLCAHVWVTRADYVGVLPNVFRLCGIAPAVGGAIGGPRSDERRGARLCTQGGCAGCVRVAPRGCGTLAEGQRCGGGCRERAEARPAPA